MSCFWATADIVRWCSTSHAMRSASSDGRAWSRQKRRASRAPSREWSPPRPFARVVKQPARNSTSRRAKSEISREHIGIVRVLRLGEPAQVCGSPSGCARRPCTRGTGRAASARRCGRTVGRVVPEDVGRGSCDAARGRCRGARGRTRRKRRRFSGSLRNAASMRWRLRHSARNVRADMPVSSRWRCMCRKASSIAPGRRSNRRSSRTCSQLVDRLELGVDRDRLRGDREQPALEVLQEDRAHLPDQPCGAVVALHQLLEARLAGVSANPSSGRGRSAGRRSDGPRAGRRGGGAVRRSRRRSVRRPRRRAPRVR